MGEHISKRDLPEFKISKEQSDKLRAVSIITKVLADDADLTRKIANEFVKAGASSTAGQAPIARYIIMRDNISRMIAEKVKMELSPERIVELYPYWYRYFIRFWFPVYYWDWEYYAGPNVGEYGQTGRG